MTHSGNRPYWILSRGEPRRRCASTGSKPSPITQHDFDALRDRLPVVDRFLVDVLAAQLRRLSGLLIETAHLDAETRIHRRLLTLAAAYGDDHGPPVITLTQDDIATMAATTRPTVNKVLRAAENAGILIVTRGKVTITDQNELAKRARTN